MRRIVLLLILFSFVIPSYSQNNADSYTPVLSVGDWWELQVTQKNVLSTEKQWNSPFLLVYKVKAINSGSYIIDVNDKLTGKTIGNLSIRKSDFHINSLSYFRRVQGVNMKQTVKFDSGKSTPVISDSSFIPYSIPAFPLKKNNNKSEMLESVPSNNKYSKVKSTSDGTFKFKRNFSQNTINSSVMVAIESEESNELIEAVGENNLKDGYYVTFKDSFLRRKVEQLWKKGYPWCLYSKSPNVKTKLLNFSMADKGGNK